MRFFRFLGFFGKNLKPKKSKIKIWNLEEKEKFILWKYAYFSRNMKEKVIYKPLFIFFVYPLRGPSPVGKLTLKNLKTHFSFYLYIYTPKLGVAIILKGFFVFMTHPNVYVIDTGSICKDFNELGFLADQNFLTLKFIDPWEI